MKILGMDVANVLPSRINRLAWWIEIHTCVPKCKYYFGPFDSKREANHYKVGYIEDLIYEKAQGISVAIKQCEPNVLTENIGE